MLPVEHPPRASVLIYDRSPLQKNLIKWISFLEGETGSAT